MSLGSEVVKIKAVIMPVITNSMKNHGERLAETWHAVDRFTMTIGKHENVNYDRALRHTTYFPPRAIIRLYRMR